MKTIAIFLSTILMMGACHAFEVAGTIKSVKGSAHIERGSERIPVTVGSQLHAQDKLLSGPGSSVGITLRDSTLLTAGPNSTIELNQYAFDRNTHAGHMDTLVRRGSLAVVSGQIAKHNPDQVVFRTGTVTLGVRGTEFIIDANAEGIDVK
jgi:hypothetical protein